MIKSVRFFMFAAVFAILAGAIAHGVPQNAFTGGRSVSGPWHTLSKRRAKPRPQIQTSSSPTRDTQAVSLASQAVSALVGSTTITDATVQGTASFVAGVPARTRQGKSSRFDVLIRRSDA